MASKVKIEAKRKKINDVSPCYEKEEWVTEKDPINRIEEKSRSQVQQEAVVFVLEEELTDE